ncbi:Late embryogenesis abundant protein [Quillaja saponaria]|uniref:Late embryogenesis abundant protein n=1 Tax=Quillaja saponaria TaxID=32244 RepID=A0AAD7KS22_QUISA|nr:Late embryogenesis abundant protein [Quillaja saponaria]
MEKPDQIKPLAPSSFHLRSDEGEAIILKKQQLRRRRCIQCCGCVTALFLILAVTFIVLLFTVFHVKEPVLRMNRVDIVNVTTNNITVIAQVSVKNSNAASFKFSNTTTTIYHNGTVVGEGKTPPGIAKARRTLRINVTVEIMPEKILATGGLSKEALNMSSYTRIDGKVKILNIVKKKVVVKMNCTMEYNITNQEIQTQYCQNHIKV